MLIFFETFLAILLLNPCFFFRHLVPYVHPSMIRHFEISGELLWNPKCSETGGLPERFASTFPLVMPFSHESEHIKHMTSLIITSQIAVFYLLPYEVIDKSHSDLDCSNSNSFPLCPPSLTSIARLFFGVSVSIFYVQVWPRKLFHTVCFWIFAASVVWPSLEGALLRPPRQGSIVQSFFNHLVLLIFVLPYIVSYIPLFVHYTLLFPILDRLIILFCLFLFCSI